MLGTRWRPLLREFAGSIHRELKITLTPLIVPDKWVFIVGCYNSGTELLMKMLGDHPHISSLPVEGQFLTDELPRDYALGLARMWVMREDLFRMIEGDSGPDVTRLKKEWLSRLDRSKSVFVEKSPPNSARTRWLQANFENAHFVAIVRNGYAVSEGIRRKAEPPHLGAGWPIDLCAEQWNRSNEVLLEDAEHLRQVHWITYEDLVEHPADRLAEVMDFLALGGDALDAADPSRSWSVHERSEPLRNMNEEAISTLTREELEAITKAAEPMLRHFDYDLLN